MASYKQLSKYNWQVVVSLGYDINGKKKRMKKQGFKTKGEAQKYANKVLEENSNGALLNTNRDMYFKDFLLKWYNEHKSLKLNVSTQTSYKGRIKNYIIPLLGDYKLTQIDVCKVQDFYNYLIWNKKLKASTAKKIMDVLSSCFKYAKRLRLISELPTDIEKVKCEKPDIQCWTEKEMNYFLMKTKNQYIYLPVFLDLMTGLRIGELCGLRWKDIDFKNKILSVNNQVIEDQINHALILSDVLKTPSSKRKIALPNILIDYLLKIKKERKATNKDFIILNYSGYMCRPRGLYRLFKHAIEKYKLTYNEMVSQGYSEEILKDYMQLKQISFHGLRHSHATLLISKGENIKVVSERLGHRDVSLTLNTYTHVIKDMEKSAAILLDNVFSSKI